MPTAPTTRSRPSLDPGNRRGDRARVRRLVERDMEALRPGEQRGWWLRDALTADPGVPCPPPGSDATADVVIVGGGYTGLWTAWWLTEHAPDTRVTILETDIVGGGASGRNGGFLTGWWDSLPSLVANFGEEAGLTAAMALDGVAGWVATWADRHGVDAGFVRGGTLVASTSPVQDGAWTGILELAAKLGVEDRLAVPLPGSAGDPRGDRRGGAARRRGWLRAATAALARAAAAGDGLRLGPGVGTGADAAAAHAWAAGPARPPGSRDRPGESGPWTLRGLCPRVGWWVHARLAVRRYEQTDRRLRNWPTTDPVDPCGTGRRDHRSNWSTGRTASPLFHVRGVRFR